MLLEIETMTNAWTLLKEIVAEQREEMVRLVSESIARSVSHNEIVPFTFYGDRAALLSVINDIRDEDVEWVEADGVVEVWGCHDVHEDIMMWRVHVDCTD